MAFSRRNFLRTLGLGGASMAVPAFLPNSARANGGSSGAPKRIIFMITMHGHLYSGWNMRPNGEPDTMDWEFNFNDVPEAQWSKSLAPLYRHRNKIVSLDGLSLYTMLGDPQAALEHEKASASLLTGDYMDKSTGRYLGIRESVDQTIARACARPDRLPSLEIGVGGALVPFSYTGKAAPLLFENNHARTWDRMFALSQGGANSLLLSRQTSMLDTVAGEAGGLLAGLGSADRMKIEAHQQRIRELETRFDGLANLECGNVPAKPEGFWEDDYNLSFETAADLITAAFACDITRVCTMLLWDLPPELCGAPIDSDIHNDYAHDAYDGGREVMETYSETHHNQLASLLDRLDSIPEGDGTMLDNTAVVLMSELSSGVHSFTPYVATIAGGLAGSWQTGRYIRYAPSVAPSSETWANWAGPGHPYTQDGMPHNHLLTSLAQGMGVTDDTGALINSVGLTEQSTIAGTMTDLTGPLPRL